jgi:hypothetical protein
MILQVFPLPVSLSVSLSVCGGAPGGRGLRTRKTGLEYGEQDGSRMPEWHNLES